MSSIRAAAAAAVLVLASPGDHVSFLVMGKTTNHRQSASGELTLLNYHFFAEIFVRDGGRVSEAMLRFPGGGSQAFEDLDYVQELHGGRYLEESELDRSYPDGSYVVRFETGDGRPVERSLRMRSASGGVSRIPPPPRITLHQAGRGVSPSDVDPSLDLTVTWSDFSSGGPDPSGILDDLVFVVLGSCRGERTVHSGRPFEGTPFLSFRAEEYVIPKDELAPGEPHQMFVEHARVDTSREDGIVGLVTYASTTFLDFTTTGTPRGAPCPPVMPGMDRGQTDREMSGEPG